MYLKYSIVHGFRNPYNRVLVPSHSRCFSSLLTMRFVFRLVSVTLGIIVCVNGSAKYAAPIHEHEGGEKDVLVQLVSSQGTISEVPYSWVRSSEVIMV